MFLLEYLLPGIWRYIHLYFRDLFVLQQKWIVWETSILTAQTASSNVQECSSQVMTLTLKILFTQSFPKWQNTWVKSHFTLETWEKNLKVWKTNIQFLVFSGVSEFQKRNIDLRQRMSTLTRAYWKYKEFFDFSTEFKG